ncbi:Pimeloyl-[acyl-carrier protein] methyl ester esterase BioH [hydrothermal vent metagenome]|uniref:Pimeloyl-[acyl-carrier protein] methyl ester esterase BioH n=1 Tax=hydrothermal vent metagenome TaxID=652676 RepID=A0A3B1A7B9_9ZZZZ
MYVNSIGAGQDLVLLHGWAMHGGVFDSLVKKLKQHYRVHVVDLPGFGFSRDDNGIYSLEQITETMLSDFDERGLKDVIVIGWSLGGLIAQNICIRKPDLVAKLVLISSVPKFLYADDWPNGIDESILLIFHVSMQEDVRKTVLRFLSLQVIGDELAMLQLRLLRQEIFTRGEPNPDALKSGLEILQKTDIRHKLHLITQPCLFFSGTHDQIVRLETVKDSVKLLQNAKYHVIDKASHALFLSHEPQFIDLLNEFLDEK